MTSLPWYRRGWIAVLAAVVFPPLGLALLFLVPGLGVIKRLLSVGLVLCLALAHLMLLWGLRFQADGSVYRPIPYFQNPERHYAEIERRSAEDRRAAVPAPAAAATPAAAAQPADSASTSSSAPWPAYFGPNRDGRYTETPILTQWPEKGLTQLWRRPVGGGYSSIIVAENLALTLEQRRDQEVLAAYDLSTGRERYAVAWKGFFRESMGGDGPRSTPSYDHGLVYVLGAEGELRCVRASSGQPVWRTNILTDAGARNIEWGMAASPLVVDNMVVVLPGGAAGRSVAAYEKLTGKLLWSALDDKAAYVSPVVATLAGRRQLVVVTSVRVAGLTLDGGKLLWDYPWRTQYDTNSTQPLFPAPDRFLISSGYDHGAALVQIEPDGSGFRAKELWQSKAMKNKFNSSVLREGVVYGLDEGILAAMDAATGQRLWKGGRYGYGQLLLAGSHLVVLTESGEVVLVKAEPAAHQEIARFEAVSGKTWNPPALAQGYLLVRNATEMACYRIAP
jgi:outer membrane protein assembly factor BamB